MMSARARARDRAEERRRTKLADALRKWEDAEEKLGQSRNHLHHLLYETPSPSEGVVLLARRRFWEAREAIMSIEAAQTQVDIVYGDDDQHEYRKRLMTTPRAGSPSESVDDAPVAQQETMEAASVSEDDLDAGMVDDSDLDVDLAENHGSGSDSETGMFDFTRDSDDGGASDSPGAAATAAALASDESTQHQAGATTPPQIMHEAGANS